MIDDKGYILLHRKIIDNPIYRIKPFSKGQALIDILILTNFKENFITIKNGQIVKIKRGQCGYSKKALADRWGWDRKTVTKFLNILESERIIKISNMGQQKNWLNHIIIDVLNYDFYQNGQQRDNNTDNNTDNKWT